MIEQLVPASVTTVATRADLHTDLLPAELRALGDAVQRRRREFQTGRACARRALARIGLPGVAIAGGERGEPLWPAGVTGSITHCDAYRACAVAWTRDVRSLGIDAEPHAPLAAGILEAIAGDGERRALAAHARGVCWDRLLFSAKEAVYKACYPLTGRTLRYEDADVRIDASGSFAARLLVEHRGGVPRELRGRWSVDGGIVATAVVVGAT